MSERSDRKANVRPSEVIYSDFTSTLRVHPNTGSIIRLTNEKSVSSALKNLILTNLGERLYQPNVGGNLKASLFEPIVSRFTANDLEDSIKRIIFNNDRRVERLKVDVDPDEERNGYRVVVEYGLRNQAETERFELVLVRTR